MRIRKSKNGRRHNGQEKKYKGETMIYKTTTEKTKDIYNF